MLDAPFDLAADLDTPVSAFLKLRPLGARVLLESVETGGTMRLSRLLGRAAAMKLLVDGANMGVDEAKEHYMGVIFFGKPAVPMETMAVPARKVGLGEPVVQRLP